MEKFVLDSPALEDAVKLRSTANYPPRRPGRNSLKEVQATGGAGAGPEYNGYFTIKDVSTYTEDGTIKEYRGAVCDGATWDAAKQTSGDSYYIVSDTSSTRRIPCTILTIKGDSDLYIRYCHCKGTADIVVRRDAPINNTGYYYYLLGSIRIVNHAMKILQRHGAYKVYLNDDRYEYVRNYNAVPTIQVNGYTGYFCIRIIEPKPSDDGTIPEPTQFAICDGNTWDPDTKTSEKSTVYVNDRVWRLSPFISPCKIRK